MIRWELIGLYNRPEALDADGTDGVYGDLEEFTHSIESGEQQIIYLLRVTEQHEKLAAYTGTSGGSPQEPTPLSSVDEELGGNHADTWE